MLGTYLRSAFWILYIILVTWVAVKSITTPSSQTPIQRSFHVGFLALSTGLASSLLLFWFYVHIWVYGTLVAHGSALFIYELCGVLCSFGGIFFGVLSKRMIRISSLAIGLVVICFWLALGTTSENVRHLYDRVSLVLALCFFLMLFWKIRPELQSYFHKT